VPVENEAEHVSRIAAAFSDDVTRRSDTALLREEELAAGLPDRRPKPARFWFLAMLLVILTVAGGIWTLAHEMGTWNLKTLRDTITETDGPALTRRLAHVITGVVILADTLVLAVMALMRSRSRLMLAIFASPLILAIAIQIWLGILLVLDGPAGVVTRFQN
jgi:hypothetical protein